MLSCSWKVGIASLGVAVILQAFPICQAAEVLPTPTGDCPVSIKGPIVLGDAGKLSAELSRLKLRNLSLEQPTGGKHSICLDSSGGSYVEGLLIGRLIFENGIGTRIPKGSSCFSACAIIFMSGRIKGNENDGPYRYIHADGRLGFHAPYISGLETKTVSGADAEQLFDLANRLAADFIRLYSYRPAFSDQPWIRTSLIAEMYAMPRDKLLIIDTIEKLQRWDISLYGHRALAPPRRENLVQACQNFQAWSMDIPSEDTAARAELATRSGGPDKDGFFHIDFSGLAETYCKVKVTKDGYLLCSVNGLTGTHHGRCPSEGLFQPFFIGLRPDTPIRTLVFSR